MKLAADVINTHLDGLLIGRHGATTRARRYHVSAVHPDGQAAGTHQRTGGNTCDHAQEAQELFGPDVTVRVLPVDEAEAA